MNKRLCQCQAHTHMAYPLARTALCLDDGAYVGADPGHTFGHFMTEPSSTLSPLEDFLQNQEASMTVTPIRADDADVSQRLTIGEPLTDTMRACTLRMRDGSTQHLAIKLATDLDDLPHAQRKMAREFAIAERILEPPEAHSREPMMMDQRAYWRVVHAQRLREDSLGYGFVHRLVHMLSSSHVGPAILCEPFDTTLAQTPPEARCLTSAGVNDGWVFWAWQIMEGLHFMRSECGMCHMDLKPDNILLRGQRCMISDFEACCPLGERACRLDLGDGRSHFARTTIAYGPLFANEDVQHWLYWVGATCGQVADFVCLSTLLSLVTFSAGDGTYVSWWTHANERTPTVVDFVRQTGLPLLPLPYHTTQASTPYLRLFHALFHIAMFPKTTNAKTVSQILWERIYRHLESVPPLAVLNAELRRATRAAAAALAAEAYLARMPPE